MARINLITRHFTDNNGSVLQTYATCKILEGLGHDVTIINLKNRSTRIGFTRIKSILLCIRSIKFYHFRRKYYSKMTTASSSIDKISIPNAEYYIVGSDQVWNMDITKENYLYYFLSFAPLGAERMSIASSFGKKSWSSSLDTKQRIGFELSKFSNISVREESGIDICQKIFNTNPQCIIDPTLALENYTELLEGKKTVSQKEIICFIFNRTKLFHEVAASISKKTDLPIRLINKIKPDKRYKGGNYMIQGPIEWLKYIKQADIVITDSFHGIVFSILFKKQFIALNADAEKFERIYSLLNSINQTSRYIPNYEYIESNLDSLINNKIDYKLVDKILKKKRAEFYNYIKKSIK